MNFSVAHMAVESNSRTKEHYDCLKFNPMKHSGNVEINLITYFRVFRPEISLKLAKIQEVIK